MALSDRNAPPELSPSPWGVKTKHPMLYCALLLAANYASCYLQQITRLRVRVIRGLTFQAFNVADPGTGIKQARVWDGF